VEFFGELLELFKAVVFDIHDESLAERMGKRKAARGLCQKRGAPYGLS
jgi:hypothetical protein